MCFVICAISYLLLYDMVCYLSLWAYEMCYELYFVVISVANLSLSNSSNCDVSFIYSDRDIASNKIFQFAYRTLYAIHQMYLCRTVILVYDVIWGYQRLLYEYCWWCVGCAVTYEVIWWCMYYYVIFDAMFDV